MLDKHLEQIMHILFLLYRHEGRVWYSEHRGRLWIASTAKEPRPEEIKDLENFYKIFYNGKVYDL